MLTIWKYTVVVDDQFVLEMPVGAQILAVQIQHGWPQLWALVNPKEEKKEYRLFRLYGTGHPIEDTRGKLEYIGTFQKMGGAAVFHLFEDVDSKLETTMNTQIELVFVDGHKARFDVDCRTITEKSNCYEVKNSISGKFLLTGGFLESVKLFDDDKLVGYHGFRPGSRYIHVSDSIDVDWVFSFNSEIA